MTAATLAYLPVQVGGVALASAGRAALWATQRFMRAPLTNTAIAALVVTCALAGSNALFGQRHAHPAPLFAPFEASTAPAAVEAAPVEAEPVVPATRPKKFGVTTTTAPVVGRPIVELAPPAAIPAADSGPIGNKDVFEVQRKLAMLKLFNGTIDGYYGPQTAGAIRKFEELNGLKVTGELTPGTVEADQGRAADDERAAGAPGRGQHARSHRAERQVGTGRGRPAAGGRRQRGERPQPRRDHRGEAAQQRAQHRLDRQEVDRTGAARPPGARHARGGVRDGGRNGRRCHRRNHLRRRERWR